jgi:GTP-binding protein YchF
MPLQVGIVGLGLVGKTTLFNALTAAHAEATAYAKASTKPNIGVARIPEPRLHTINQYIKTEEIVPATIQVVDVAGLARGASTGHGGGNKFLGHLRDMDAIVHVVRAFESDQVAHPEGKLDPARDIDTVETELILADLESASGQIDRAERVARTGEKEAIHRLDVLKKVYAKLNDSRPIRELDLTPEQQRLVRQLGFITAKKTLFVANVGEGDLAGQSPLAQKVAGRAAAEGAPAIAICGKLEAEIAELPPGEQGEMLAGMGLKEPALAVLARAACTLLGLHYFFTAGPRQIRAWPIPIGATAPQAAGSIHSDFERGFIRAEIYTLDDLVQYRTEAAIKHAGKLRVEGKNYVMREGDITHFLFNV